MIWVGKIKKLRMSQRMLPSICCYQSGGKSAKFSFEHIVHGAFLGQAPATEVCPPPELRREIQAGDINVKEPASRQDEIPRRK